jgi:hypothetical protein
VADEPSCRLVLEHRTLRDPVGVERASTRRDLRAEVLRHFRERRCVGPEEWSTRLEELVDERMQLGGVLRVEVGAESDL